MGGRGVTVGVWVIVWVYRDAEKRRMNGLLWALLVLIGNLIGVIIYLLVRNGTGENAEKGMPATQIGEAEPQSDSTTCPNCSETIQKHFVFCPSCGNKINEACPECKEPVQSGWQVCAHCGHRLKG